MSNCEVLKTWVTTLDQPKVKQKSVKRNLLQPTMY